MDKPEPTAVLFATLPVSLHQALKDRAKEERRSMNAQAIIAIEEHLAKEKATA